MFKCQAALLVSLVFGMTSSACATDRVAIAEYVDVDDARLYVEIRGRPADGRLLVWLHGGPGGPERPLFRYFNGELEQDFLVAYLDQRGAGRSFDADAPAARLTVAQHIADLDRVVDRLRTQFGRERVLLVGHSWGSVLGTLYAAAHPDKVSGLICVAPVIAFAEQYRREYAYDLAEATRRGDERALRDLREIGPPPYPEASSVNRLQRVTERYRGVEFQSHNHALIVLAGLAQGLVTPGELMHLGASTHRSLNAMHQELAALDLRNEVSRVDIPVFFFLGRHDHHVDANLAAEFFVTLSAPRKELFWFEQSAHDIPFDEADLFDQRVIEVARTLGD